MRSVRLAEYIMFYRTALEPGLAGGSLLALPSISTRFSIHVLPCVCSVPSLATRRIASNNAVEPPASTSPIRARARLYQW